jgi:hypothetical protein
MNPEKRKRQEKQMNEHAKETEGKKHDGRQGETGQRDWKQVRTLREKKQK